MMWRNPGRGPSDPEESLLLSTPLKFTKATPAHVLPGNVRSIPGQNSRTVPSKAPLRPPHGRPPQEQMGILSASQSAGSFPYTATLLQRAPGTAARITRRVDSGQREWESVPMTVAPYLQQTRITLDMQTPTHHEHTGWPSSTPNVGHMAPAMNCSAEGKDRDWRDLR